jgi:hypothetical protein
MNRKRNCTGRHRKCDGRGRGGEARSTLSRLGGWAGEDGAADEVVYTVGEGGAGAWCRGSGDRILRHHPIHGCAAPHVVRHRLGPSPRCGYVPGDGEIRRLQETRTLLPLLLVLLFQQWRPAEAYGAMSEDDAADRRAQNRCRRCMLS